MSFDIVKKLRQHEHIVRRYCRMALNGGRLLYALGSLSSAMLALKTVLGFVLLRS